MAKKTIIRIWQEVDIDEVGPQLLIAGSTTADCGKCKEISLPFDTRTCPKCGTYFKYMSTRISESPGEAKRLKAKRPDLIIVDFRDFKDIKARNKAKGLWGD